MEYILGSGAGWAWVGCEIKCEDASLGNVWVERGTAI